MSRLTKEQALNRLAGYCSKAERCLEDIRKKMLSWELSSADREEIVRFLQKEHFLDEERYAKAFVRDKSRLERWGEYKIRYALRSKQIPESLINRALQEIDRKENREQLRLLLEQKRRSIRGKSEAEIRQKLFRFAVSRGFPIDEIEKCISGDERFA